MVLKPLIHRPTRGNTTDSTGTKEKRVTAQNSKHKHSHDWMALCLQTPVVILPKTKTKLQVQLKDNHIAMSALAHTISQDPGACLKVLSAANGYVKAQMKDTQITSITHCLAILGQVQTKKLLQQLKPIASTPEQSHYQFYARAMMRSLHAAYQAKQWARYRFPELAQQIYFGAMLSDAPQWVLWQAAPAQMKLIEHLQCHERISPHKAQLAILGTTLDSIATKLFEYWHLPEQIQPLPQTLSHTQIKALLKASKAHHNNLLGALKPRSQSHEPLISPKMIMLLANWLSVEADIDWQSRQMHRVTGVVAAFINQPIERTKKIILTNALEASRQYHLTGVASPGCSLLQALTPAPKQLPPPEHTQFQQKIQLLLKEGSIFSKNTIPTHRPMIELSNTISGIISKQSTIDQNTRLKNPALFQKLANKIKEQAHTFEDVSNFLNTIVYCLEKAIGLPGITIMLLDEQSHVLKTAKINSTNNTCRERLSVPLANTPLLEKLIKKPAALNCSEPLKHQNIFNLLPSAFKENLTDQSGFLLASLFTQQTPLGIIFIDSPKEERLAITTSQYEAFKKICHLTAQGLLQLQVRQIDYPIKTIR